MKRILVKDTHISAMLENNDLRPDEEILSSVVGSRIVELETYPDDFEEAFEAGKYKYVNGSVEIDVSIYSRYERTNRNQLLREEVDPIVTNPLRWNSMTPARQQEWIDYRQALLDVPSQPGFPENIVWPVKPE